MTILHPAGERGLLVDVDDGRAAALVQWIENGPLRELVASIIPASRSVLVVANDERSIEGLRPLLAAGVEATRAGLVDDVGGAVHHVGTRYGGPDLADAAVSCGLSEREFAIAHAESEHRIGFFGFAPGFAYIDGLDPRLDLSRRANPRKDVPAGTIAVAAGQSVIYPGGTPGGWHLIAQTDFVSWDVESDPPTPFAVGDRIVFEPIGPLP